MNKNTIFEDIQLFAETTFDGNSTESVNIESDQSFWETALIRLAGPKLVHDQFAQQIDIPAGNGKHIEFRKVENLSTDIATNLLEEGVSGEGQALSIVGVGADVAQYGNYIKSTDMLELTAKDNIMDIATNACSDQAAGVMDKITRNVMHQCSVSMCAGGVDTLANVKADTYIDPDDLFKAAALLESVNAPTIDGFYVAIMHPFVAKDLMSKLGGSTAWTEVMKYADPSKILRGEVGTYGKVRVVTTTNAKFYKAGDEDFVGGPEGVDVFSTIVVGSGAYGTTKLDGGGLELIVHAKNEIGGPLNQYSTVGWKATKASEILVDQYMVKIYSSASQVLSASN